MKIPSTLIESPRRHCVCYSRHLRTNILYRRLSVDSVVTIDVLNTPPGMSVDCNTSNCVFLGGTVACGD